MAEGSQGIIEEQNLERMICNLFHCRDGQSKFNSYDSIINFLTLNVSDIEILLEQYAMYFTFELPITYGEFVNQNRHVLVDCSHEVLNACVQTIEESKLGPTS